MRILIALMMLFGAAYAQDETASAAVERYYCTQQGPFFLRFGADKAAGVFADLEKNDIGAVIGKLEERVFTGTWMVLDSKGPIRLEFSDDWSSFEATYAVAPDKEPWRTGWTGYLPPAGDPGSFNISGETFRCR